MSLPRSGRVVSRCCNWLRTAYLLLGEIGRMDRAQYNAQLQEVQEIEDQVGYPILRPYQYYDGERLAECGYSLHGFTVFRQTNPFTDHSRYFVDESQRRKIIYCDFIL